MKNINTNKKDYFILFGIEFVTVATSFIFIANQFILTTQNKYTMHKIKGNI